MTDKKISQMPESVNLTDTDIFPMVDNPESTDINAKITWLNIKRSIYNLQTVHDVDYNALPTDLIIIYNTALTNDRVVTLPLAASVKPGYPIIIGDGYGSASTTNTISITTQDGDDLNDGSPEVISNAKGFRHFYSDGIENWYVEHFSQNLLANNNLSDLTNIPAARTALGLGTAALAALTDLLQKTNNLSDLASVSIARGNLGLSTAALQDIAFFLQAANNLSDLGNTTIARGNLGLGTAAILAAAAVLQSANNLSDLGDINTARANLGVDSVSRAKLSYIGWF